MSIAEQTTNLLDLSTYLVKERVGWFKFNCAYDIYDPETQQQVGMAIERPPALTNYLRIFIDRHFLPTRIDVSVDEFSPPIFTIRKPANFIRSKMEVLDEHGDRIGYFLQKWFKIGGGFHVYDADDQHVAEVNGDWKGWNFKFTTGDGQEIGTVTKKWSGLGKEMFTTADNYIISLSDGLPDRGKSALLLAAGLTVDQVLKEQRQ